MQRIIKTPPFQVSVSVTEGKRFPSPASDFFQPTELHIILEVKLRHKAERFSHDNSRTCFTFSMFGRI